MAYQDNNQQKEYKNDGVLMGNVKSPTVRFEVGITKEQASDLLKYVTDTGWINFNVEFTRNGKAIMKVIDPRLRAANAPQQNNYAQKQAAPAPVAGGDDLPF